jgi:hypothetical protein
MESSVHTRSMTQDASTGAGNTTTYSPERAVRQAAYCQYLIDTGSAHSMCDAAMLLNGPAGTYYEACAERAGYLNFEPKA